jgi:hypothetical protein
VTRLARIALVTAILILLAVSTVGQVGVRISIRYQLDFIYLLLIAGIIGWLASTRSDSPVRPTRKRLLNVAAILAICVGSVIGVATSLTGYYDALRIYNPSVFNRIETFTSPFPTAITMMLGRPVITHISSPLGASSKVSTYVTLGAGSDLALNLGSEPAEIEIIAPGNVSTSLEGTVVGGRNTQPLGLQRFVVAGSGWRAEVGTTNGQLQLPVRLRRGFNRISVTALFLERPKTLDSSEPATDLYSNIRLVSK